MSRKAKRKQHTVFVASTLESVAAEQSSDDPENEIAQVSTQLHLGMSEAAHREFRQLMAAGERERALQNLSAWLRETTHASGAAIALSIGDEVVCLASDGTAPPVGVVIDPSTGISGACLQTRKLVVCNDAETDPRVNKGAGHYIRSIVAAPVVAGSRTDGLVEILSNVPYAFGTDQQHIVADVALVLSSDEKLPVAIGRHESAEVEPEGTDSLTTLHHLGPVFTIGGTPEEPSRAAAASAWLRGHAAALVANRRMLVMASAMVLAVITLVWLMVSDSNDAPTTTQAAVSQPAQPVAQPTPTAATDLPQNDAVPTATVAPPAAKKQTTTSTSKGASQDEESLRVRVPSSATTKATKDEPPTLAFAGPAVNALSIPERTPAVQLSLNSQRSGGQLLHKVTPAYPAFALSQKLSGQVELIASVGPNGRVSKVRVVSGNGIFAQAAVEAVRQWRYSPLMLDGRAVPQELPITISFKPREE